MNVFVCTKPLQIITAMILSKDKGAGFLYLVDSFSGAGSLLESSELKSWFLGVKIFDSRNIALLAARKLKPSAIFLDSDVGLKPYLIGLFVKLHLKETMIFVYEEGVGTYRKDIIKPRLKRRIYQLFGVGTFLGGSKLTSKCFVFDKDKYVSKFGVIKSRVENLPISIESFFDQHVEKILRIFQTEISLPERKSKKATIFLTGWNPDIYKINSSASDSLTRDFFLKLHPHVKRIDLKSVNSAINILPTGVPGELVLLVLSSSYESLDVLHYGTSSEAYMSGLNNLNWINVS